MKKPEELEDSIVLYYCCLKIEFLNLVDKYGLESAEKSDVWARQLKLCQPSDWKHVTSVYLLSLSFYLPTARPIQFVDWL